MVQSLRNISLQAAAIIACSAPWSAFAQLDTVTETVAGEPSTNLRQLIIDVLQTVLTFIALIAVIVIIIAGIRFIISQGDEGEKDKARKTIVYAIIGLVIILLAKAIVNFVISTMRTTPAA